MKVISRKCKYTEENFIGREFGRLTVLSYSGKGKYGRYWDCVCSCGQKKVIHQASLVNGRTQSCGCLQKETVTKNKNRLTHGLTESRLYVKWSHIKARCYNHNDVNYKNYGGRGIKMSNAWRLRFESFYKDTHESWFPGATIERKDVNGDYTKDNCVWAAGSRQACNTRATVWVVYRGSRMCLTDASRASGVAYSTLKNRIKNKCPTNRLFEEAHSGKPN
jgi:hypothetical protein